MMINNDDFKSFVEPLVDLFQKLNDWLYAERGGLLLFVVGVAISIAAGAVVSWLLQRVLLRLTAKTKTNFDDKIVEAIHRPTVYLVVISGIVCSLTVLNLPYELKNFGKQLYFTAAILIVVWGTLRIIDTISTYLKRIAANNNNALDDLLIDLLRRVFKVTLWVIAFIFVAQNIFELNVSAMLAGAGVVSLAVAFAAQNTIANVFGAVTLILDKPFTVGSRIKVGDKDGTVETVGLRSTKLRALDGTLWVIPNKEMADSSIQNFTARPNFKHIFDIGLVYSTTPEQMVLATKILHEILDNNALFDMQELPPRIYFSDLKDWSLNIQAVVWFQTIDWYLALAEREKINFQILERFNEAGLEFAFPSQTNYLVNVPNAADRKTLENQTSTE